MHRPAGRNARHPASPRWRSLAAVANTNGALLRFAKFLFQIPHQLLQAIFGDGTRVTVKGERPV
jgi:hypothetical protein